MMSIRPLLILCLLSLTTSSRSQDVFETKDVFVDLKFGSVEVTDKDGKTRTVSRESESSKFFPVRVRPGDSLEAGESADCHLILAGAGTAKLQPKARIKVPAAKEETGKDESSLELLEGKLFLSIDSADMAKKKKQFRLKTPTAVLAVKGTRFFVDAQPELETAGVHEGQVVMVESTSKRFATIDAGNAVLAKPGAITKPRRLTEEESALSDIYSSIELELIPAERQARKFETSYGAQEDPNSAIRTDYPKLIEATDSEGLDDTAVKVTFQTYPKDKTISVSAAVKFEVPVRLRSTPAGVCFLMKSEGVRGFQLSGVLEADKKHYSPVLPDGNVIQFPKGTKPDEWVSFFVPLEETDYVQDLETISVSVNPNLTEDRAVERVISVEKGRAEYHLEISPLMIGVIPGT